jgi:hypothetical protein
MSREFCLNAEDDFQHESKAEDHKYYMQQRAKAKQAAAVEREAKQVVAIESGLKDAHL